VHINAVYVYPFPDCLNITHLGFFFKEITKFLFLVRRFLFRQKKNSMFVW
jgi:hypothetical protein